MTDALVPVVETPAVDAVAAAEAGVVLAGSAAIALPRVIVDAGPVAVGKFVEFFAGRIANERTRAAYARAAGQFLGWCEARGLRLEVPASSAALHPAEPDPGRSPRGPPPAFGVNPLALLKLGRFRGGLWDRLWTRGSSRRPERPVAPIALQPSSRPQLKHAPADRGSLRPGGGHVDGRFVGSHSLCYSNRRSTVVRRG